MIITKIIYELLFWLMVFFSIRKFIKILSIYRSEKDLDYMPYYCMSIAYVGMIYGAKGSFKSSLLNFISQMITIGLKQKTYSRMQEIKIALSDLDFNDINNYLENAILTEIERQNLIDTNQLDRLLIKRKFVQYLDHFNHSKILNSYYTDHISIKSKYDLLLEYMICYFDYFYPGDYMLHNGYRYDIAHQRLAKQLDITSLNMREVLKGNNNWQLCSPVVMTYDEASHTHGNVHSNEREVKLSGTTETLSLIRNGGKNKIYVWYAAQVPKNFVKDQRDQVNKFLTLTSKKTVKFFPVLQRLFNRIQKIITLIFKLAFRFSNLKTSEYIRKFKEFSNSPNVMTKSISFFENCKNYLSSLDIFIVKFKAYNKVEEVESLTSPHDTYRFVGHKFQFWGTFDSHSYEDLFTVLETKYSSNSQKEYISKINSSNILNDYLNK